MFIEISKEDTRNLEGLEMADIRDSKNWGFETRQLHIGQEKAEKEAVIQEKTDNKIR